MGEYFFRLRATTSTFLEVVRAVGSFFRLAHRTLRLAFSRTETVGVDTDVACRRNRALVVGTAPRGQAIWFALFVFLATTKYSAKEASMCGGPSICCASQLEELVGMRRLGQRT